MKRIEFLPERVRAHRMRVSRLRRLACLVVLFAAAAAGLAHVRQGRLARAQAQLDLLQESAGNLKRQVDARAPLERQLADLMIKKRIDEHLGTRIDALDVLAEMGRLLPESMALTNLALETMETQAVEAPARHGSARAGAPDRSVKDGPKDRTEKRVRLVLTGLAPSDVDVASFIGQLSSSPFFEDVNMGYAKNVVFRGRSAREFQASCYVVR